MSARIEMLKQLGRLVYEHPEAPVPAGAAPLTARHAPSGHVSLWNYEHQQYRLDVSNTTQPVLFNPEYGELPLDEILKETRFFVVIGAVDSPELAMLKQRKDVVVLLFEPDPATFADYAGAMTPAAIGRTNTYFMVGDLSGRGAFAIMDLPQAFMTFGYPAVLIRQGLRTTYPEYVDSVIQRMELLYYRRIIYYVSGQSCVRNQPTRELTHSDMFDQRKHAYENIHAFTTKGNSLDLAGRLAGRTAILVGAGPDLDNRIDFLRENRDRAAIFCVNNALKPLLKHGIVPHFLVINDSSIEVERSFEGVPPLPDTILISHCVAYAGGGVFGRQFFIHDWHPEIFGERHCNPLHGSVITNALTMAEFMGCSRFVLVGVQLASARGDVLSYSKDSNHGASLKNDDFSFYPVRSDAGDWLFTNLNFYDSAVWFLDYVAQRGLSLVNTSRDSLLFGPNIRIDENPDIPDAPDMEPLVASIKMQPPRLDMNRVKGFILEEIDTWRNIRKTAGQVMVMLNDPGNFPVAEQAVATMDKTGLGFMLQRFCDYDNAAFYYTFFNGLAMRWWREKYLEIGARLAQEFMATRALDLLRIAYGDAASDASDRINAHFERLMERFSPGTDSRTELKLVELSLVEAVAEAVAEAGLDWNRVAPLVTDSVNKLYCDGSLTIKDGRFLTVQGSLENRIDGAWYYFRNLRDMAATFISILAGQLGRVKADGARRRVS